MRTRVVPVPLSVSNTHLLLGDRPVLVDTGVPGEEARLAGVVREHRVAPQDLAPIALTHGHTDHAGSVNGVAAGGAPVAIGAGDAGPLEWPPQPVTAEAG